MRAGEGRPQHRRSGGSRRGDAKAGAATNRERGEETREAINGESKNGGSLDASKLMTPEERVELRDVRGFALR